MDGPYKFAGIICGTVVDDDKFDNNAGFAKDFGDEATDGSGGIKYKNDDADINQLRLYLWNEHH